MKSSVLLVVLGASMFRQARDFLCRSHLYGALLDRPKQSAGGAASNTAIAGQTKQGKVSSFTGQQQSKSKARVVRTDTSKEVLDDLLQRWKFFKTEVMQVSQSSASIHLSLIFSEIFIKLNL